jgi:hypothetical protein
MCTARQELKAGLRPPLCCGMQDLKPGLQPPLCCRAEKITFVRHAGIEAWVTASTLLSSGINHMCVACRN